MKKAVIVGAGKHGEVYLSYLRAVGVPILGFIDDDIEKVGKVFQGTQVIGTYEDLFSKKFKDKITDVYCPSNWRKPNQTKLSKNSKKRRLQYTKLYSSFGNYGS
jgi:FlaA1/EpsC-like NDP-sugar epimerase